MHLCHAAATPGTAASRRQAGRFLCRFLAPTKEDVASGAELTLPQRCVRCAGPAGLDGCSQKPVYVLKSDVLTEGNAFVSAEAFTLLLSEEGAKPVRRT